MNLKLNYPLTKLEILAANYKWFVLDKHDPGWEGECVYHTHEGNKCGIGCLLPDEISSDLPSGPVEDILEEIQHKFSSDVDLRFLDQIQVNHDLLAEEDWSIDSFRHGLKMISQFWGVRCDQIIHRAKQLKYQDDGVAA